VFSELDLVIPAGSSTAIVGVNGSGKTTLVKLLSRLHDPTGGRISIDGVDLREFDAQQWQRRIGVVFQDFNHYPLSARDNVGFGSVEHLDDLAAISATAERAGVRDFVESLPGGWETVLSKEFTNGTELSGGQWQRIALARALFAARHAAGVLVLDEPTAWLDVRGEAAFYEQFLEMTRGLTTIVISHRFSTVRLADRILVVENGLVSESGSHDSLVAEGGTYAEMFRLQAARFVEENDPSGQPA
jgi:ATP-binding cassette subfamily B protein